MTFTDHEDNIVEHQVTSQQNNTPDNSLQTNPCYADCGTPNPVYHDIDDAINEKEKYLYLTAHRQSTSSINPYEMDYEITTFTSPNNTLKNNKPDNFTNANEDAYVIMNPSC